MYVRFEVFTAVTMKNAVFWDMALCRSCVNRCFGGMYRHHLQGRKNLSLTDSVCSHLLTLFRRSRTFLPWRWRRYVPQKRRLTQDLHSATSQKTTFFNFLTTCFAWHQVSSGLLNLLHCMSQLRIVCEHNVSLIKINWP
jgi:hypothetical protein